MQTVYEISRTTGKVLHSYGRYGEYTVAEGSIPFWLQHDVHFIDDATGAHTGLRMFATDTSPGGAAGPIEYQIDEATKTLVTTWNYGVRPPLDPAITSVALGQAIPLENGNVFVSYGAQGSAREVTPDGHVAWGVGLGSATYFGQLYPFEQFPPR
jgi:hypothetical protein